MNRPAPDVLAEEVRNLRERAKAMGGGMHWLETWASNALQRAGYEPRRKPKPWE